MSESLPGEETAVSTAADDDSSSGECPECGSRFDSERGMKIHYGKCHEGTLAGEVRECAHCGAESRYTEWSELQSENNFCNRECMAAYYSEELVGENNPHWEGGKESMECETCGGVFEVLKCHADKRRFCSNGCKGEWASEAWVGENHPRWVDNGSPSYGSRWKRIARDVRERDNYECQACGVHRNKLDRNLQVHHIAPLREFDDVEEANDKDNLISLCKPCHTRWEGVWLAPDNR